MFIEDLIIKLSNIIENTQAWKLSVKINSASKNARNQDSTGG